MNNVLKLYYKLKAVAGREKIRVYRVGGGKNIVNIMLYPSNMNELRKAVNLARKYRVKVIYDNLTVFTRENALKISLEKFSKIVKVDLEGYKVEVEPGAKIGGINKVVESRGLWIPCCSECSRVSVYEAALNEKCSILSLGYGKIADYIGEVKIKSLKGRTIKSTAIKEVGGVPTRVSINPALKPRMRKIYVFKVKDIRKSVSIIKNILRIRALPDSLGLIVSSKGERNTYVTVSYTHLTLPTTERV